MWANDDTFTSNNRINKFSWYLHKCKSFQARERPIIVKPPPDTAVPKPSLISVSRCNTQQNSTAIVAKIDDNEIDVSIDSQSSNKRIESSNIQSKVLLVWSGRSDLEGLSEKKKKIILFLYQNYVHLSLQISII